MNTRNQFEDDKNSELKIDDDLLDEPQIKGKASIGSTKRLIVEEASS